MVDFIGNKIVIGSKIFFYNNKKKPVIGNVSEIKGKKTIIIYYKDVIKMSKKCQKEFNEILDINGKDVYTHTGFTCNSDNVLVIK